MDTALSVAALVVSLFSAGFTLYTFIWTKVRDRKQATLEAYNRLQEQVLDHLNVYMPKQIAEIAKNTRSEEYKQISAYLRESSISASVSARRFMIEMWFTNWRRGTWTA